MSAAAPVSAWRGGLALVLMLASLVLAPAGAWGQAPLRATIFLKNAPANLTYDATLTGAPLTIVVQIENTSGADVFTTEDLAAALREAWRLLYFTRPDGGIVTNTAAASLHVTPRVGSCLSRQGVLQTPTAIPVVPIVVLAGPPTGFSLEFNIDDARRFFDLTRPGRHTAQLRFPLLVYQPGGAVIQDCDQFPNTALANVGAGVGLGRAELEIASNEIQFFIRGTDTTPPTSSVTVTPTPNAAGWNRDNVTLGFTAADGAGGSGVNRIEVTLTGAQSGAPVIPGTAGTVGVTAEGTTSVSFRAVDESDNGESPHTITVKLDKTAPVVSPPANLTTPATETGGARGSASAALSSFLAGGTATDNLDAAPARLTPQVGGTNATNATLFPVGNTSVTFRFQDVAGNLGFASAQVTVIPGSPAISVTIPNKGVDAEGRWYDLSLKNTGTGIARGITVSQLLFRTLSGTGTVTYNAAASPALPATLGDLAVGASTTMRVHLNVPATVTRFTISESGRFQNVVGTSSNFAAVQAVFP